MGFLMGLALGVLAGLALIVAFARYQNSRAAHRRQLGGTRTLAAGVGSPQPAVSDDPSCEGRRVYMLDLPSRFDLLGGCLEGSSEFMDQHGACSVMSNDGLGAVLLAPEPGNNTDGGVIPNDGGWFNTDHHALEVIFHSRMRRYACHTTCGGGVRAILRRYGAEPLHLRHQRYGARRAFGGVPPVAVVAAALGDAGRARPLHGRVQDHVDVPARALRRPWLRQRLPQPARVLEHDGAHHRVQHLGTPGHGRALPHLLPPIVLSQVEEWQSCARDAHRPWLFAFAGARRPNGVLVLRDRIIDKCASTSRCGMLDCSNGLEGSITCRSPEKLMSLFMSSRFCLQPCGDSFMRRSSVDAVVAGCIPVFFHEASTFEKQYRWHEPDNHVQRRYSVFIDLDDVLQGKVDIEEVLSRYADEEVAAMREEVIKMIPRFVYKDPRVRFEGYMRDGFDIAIDEVLARMRRINKSEDLGWDIME